MCTYNINGPWNPIWPPWPAKTDRQPDNKTNGHRQKSVKSNDLERKMWLLTQPLQQSAEPETQRLKVQKPAGLETQESRLDDRDKESKTEISTEPVCNQKSTQTIKIKLKLLKIISKCKLQGRKNLQLRIISLGILDYLISKLMKEVWGGLYNLRRHSSSRRPWMRNILSASRLQSAVLLLRHTGHAHRGPGHLAGEY